MVLDRGGKGGDQGALQDDPDESLQVAVEIEQRVRVVENTAAEVNGAVKSLKWAITLVAPILGTILLVAIGALIASIMELKGAVATHSERTDGLKSQHGADVARLDKAIDGVNARLQAADRVKTTAWVGSLAYHEHVGKIERRGKDQVTLQEEDGDVKVEYTFAIDPGARVLIKDQGAKLEDLKPGMLVRVLHKDRKKVELIETVEDQAPPPKPPAP